MSVERYREIVPEWSRFREVSSTPEPTTVRVRTGRISPSRLVERLEARGFRLHPVPGLPGVLRVEEEPFPVGTTLEHELGLLYVQQASTTVAAPALGAGPGERVLDLCAAPGGKTTHIAELMEDRGCLVASDFKEKRLRALLGNVYRLGHPNVLALSADGRSFPGGALFDRILVDVPCSAEGNLRDRGGEVAPQSGSFREHIAGVQTGLLRRALELARPGGVVLYATCTFAPEENEAVVSRVLEEFPGVDVEPLELDLPHAPGLVSFEEVSFDPRLEAAWRIYPHHLDSGGLFLCRLRRGGGGSGGRADGSRAPGAGWGPVAPVFPGRSTPREEAEERVARGIEMLAGEFGVPRQRLRELGWVVRGKSVWAHRLGEWPAEAWETGEGWRVLSIGLRALKRDGRWPERPATELLRWLDDAVTRRVVELDPEEAVRLLGGEELEVESPEHGFAVLRSAGWTLGRGWVTRGSLGSEVPKAQGKAFRRALGQLPGGGEAGG